MNSYSINTVCSAIQAQRIGNSDGVVQWLLTDSRSLSFPETSLFFAIKTERNDGARYIPELYRRGVRNFVVSELPEGVVYADANYLVVDSPLVALQRLAEQHRRHYDVPVVAITGSNGKTIVKEWIYQL